MLAPMPFTTPSGVITPQGEGAMYWSSNSASPQFQSSSSSLSPELNTHSPCADPINSKRPPLTFSFKGYTIWIDIHEYNNDLTNSMSSLTSKLGLHSIPQSHITLLYGESFPCDDTAKRAFDNVTSNLKINKHTNKSSLTIPNFLPSGVVCDKETCGVNGGAMDMMWGEISFTRSGEHDRIFDIAVDAFRHDLESTITPNKSKWLPHISLAYDNPHSSPLTLTHVTSEVSNYPSLLSARRVRGLSLWKTEGRMEGWVKVDSFLFEEENEWEIEVEGIGNEVRRISIDNNRMME